MVLDEICSITETTETDPRFKRASDSPRPQSVAAIGRSGEDNADSQNRAALTPEESGGEHQASGAALCYAVLAAAAFRRVATRLRAHPIPTLSISSGRTRRTIRRFVHGLGVRDGYSG
jgi:hypothetical protein